jgi:hypothetical protein
MKQWAEIGIKIPVINISKRATAASGVSHKRGSRETQYENCEKTRHVRRRTAKCSSLDSFVNSVILKEHNEPIDIFQFI